MILPSQLQDIIVKYIDSKLVCQMNNFDIMGELLMHNVTYSLYQKYGNNSEIYFKLFESPWCVHFIRRVLKHIIKKYKIDLDSIPKDKEFQILIKAIVFTDIDLIKIILDNGADINKYGTKGATPLTVACSNACGDLEIVKLLLKYGADINKGGSNMNIPSLAYAITINNISIINYLLNNGADIEHHDTSGNSPLMYAIGIRDLNVIKLLLKRGANPNSVNNNGKSVLIDAILKSDVSIVELLIKNGVDINRYDNNQEIPLMYAVYHGNVEITKLLLENGADIKAVNNNLESIMNYALTGFNTVHNDSKKYDAIRRLLKIYSKKR